MLDSLKPLAKKILETQDMVAENAAAIRSAGRAPEEFEEKDLILPVRKSAPDFSVCAVDGGLLADRMVGSDIVIRRSVAVNFVYQDSRLKTVHHHPGKFPEPEIGFMNGLDEHEALAFRSLFRLKGEISAALEALEKFKPDYLLLDGSVVLLGSDKPGDGSLLSEDYKELLKTYKMLYQRCETQNCQLAGVIKDSRGKRLTELLRDQLLVDVSDTVLADALLSENERTSVLGYTSDAAKHPVLTSLGEWAGRIKLFYLRPSASDSPLRIEFVKSKKGVDEIAADICSLCSISKAFAYPAILVEADMCAALEPTEMEKIKSSLFVMTGGATKPLRRAVRPFR